MRDYSVISGKTLTIRRTNPRTPIFIYIAFVFLIGFPVMYLIAPGMRNLPWFFLIMVAAITILNLRVWGLLTLITIGQDGVLYKSPITERLYPWSEIRTAGMYLKYGNRVHVLDRHLYNEKYFVKLKYVWFSRNPAGAPSVFTFPGEDYCDFEFNKNAWELFNRYLIGIDDPNNLQSSSKLRAQESERRGF